MQEQVAKFLIVIAGIFFVALLIPSGVRLFVIAASPLVEPINVLYSDANGTIQKNQSFRYFAEQTLGLGYQYGTNPDRNYLLDVNGKVKFAQNVDFLGTVTGLPTSSGKTYTSGTPSTVQVDNDANTVSQNFDGNFSSRFDGNFNLRLSQRVPFADANLSSLSLTKILYDSNAVLDGRYIKLTDTNNSARVAYGAIADFNSHVSQLIGAGGLTAAYNITSDGNHTFGAGNYEFPGALYVDKNLGIGTNSARARLDVNGDVLFGNNALLDSAGKTFLTTEARANAVNYVQIRNAEAGVGVGLHATGSDSSINIDIRPKGTGYVIIDGAKNAAGYMYGSGTIGNGFFVNSSSSSAPLSLGTGIGSQHVFIGTDGNIGMGTVSPLVKLDVRGIGMFTNHAKNLLILNSSGTNYGTIQNDAADTWSLGTTVATETLGTPILTWYKDGNVGIGTTSPTEAFVVQGTGSTVDMKTLQVRYTTGSANSANLSFAALQLGNNSQNDIVAGNTTAGGYLRFFVNNTNNLGNTAYNAANGALAMLIDSTTKVGIGGDTTPDANLEVAGTFMVSGNAGAGDGNRFIVNAAGNVGIGTASPAGVFNAKTEISTSDNSAAATLNIVNTSNTLGGRATGIRFVEGSAQTSMALIYHQSSTGGGAVGDGNPQFMIADQNSVPITFFTGGIGSANERMRIAADGNVGIGTTTPNRRLHVSGDSNFDGNIAFGGVGFRFPRVLGSANQVLSTDSFGNLSWVTQSGGPGGSGDVTWANLTSIIPWADVNVANNITIKSSNDANFYNGLSSNIVSSVDNNSLALRANNITGMVIGVDGNVGIGIETPTGAFQVSNNWAAKLNPNLIYVDRNSGAVGINRRPSNTLDVNGPITSNNSATFGGTISTTGGLSATGGSTTTISFPVNGTTTFNYGGQIRGSTTITATAGNNVAGLLVNGSPWTEPASGTLNIFGTAMLLKPRINAGGGDTNYTTALYVEDENCSVGGTLGCYSVWVDGGKERHDGNVMIGSTLTTPIGVLDINASNNGAGARVVVGFDGNMGIGTTAPKNTLNVVGDVNATNGFKNNGAIGITQTITYLKDGVTSCQMDINGGIITKITGAGC